jgi:hypothetical protein
VRCTVGIYKTVNTEVPAVRLLTPISAIGVALIGEHRVVAKLPNAAAKEAIVSIDHIPIRLEVSGAHAHSVRVFTKEYRLIGKHALVNIVFLYVVRLPIHMADDITALVLLAPLVFQ